MHRIDRGRRVIQVFAFYLFAALVILSGALVIFSRNPVHSGQHEQQRQVQRIMIGQKAQAERDPCIEHIGKNCNPPTFETVRCPARNGRQQRERNELE